MNNGEEDGIELRVIGHKDDVDSHAPPDNDKEESYEGFLTSLKRLAERFIGTEEERAQWRAEKERKKEEDRQRRELEYEKETERQEQYATECAERVWRGMAPRFSGRLDDLSIFLEYVAIYDRRRRLWERGW